MSQEGINVINKSKSSLAQFALCWIPDNMQRWREAREERRVCMCVTGGSVDESQREPGIDGVSHRACPSTGSQTLQEMISFLVH